MQYSKQNILLNGLNYFLILLENQTAQLQLQIEREERAGIVLANKCISNQIFEPLKNVNKYVDILIRNLQQRHECVSLLETIKYWNRMI
jgi:hypothetical protein